MGRRSRGRLRGRDGHRQSHSPGAGGEVPAEWVCSAAWRWTMFEYDTIRARIHPGGNTGTKTSYYTESPIKNWTDLVGKDFKFNQGFVQLRNRAPKILLREIYLSVKINPWILADPGFWFYASIAVIFPGWILRPLSDFYRHYITRRSCRIIERPT